MAMMPQPFNLDDVILHLAYVECVLSVDSIKFLFEINCNLILLSLTSLGLVIALIPSSSHPVSLSEFSSRVSTHLDDSILKSTKSKGDNEVEREDNSRFLDLWNRFNAGDFLDRDEELKKKNY
jgi:hypothetical protein